MRLESWAGSDVGLVRERNEDSVGCFPDLGLFIVADGLGGHASGEVASRLAVESIRDFLARAAPAPAAGILHRARNLFGGGGGDGADEALCAAVLKADENIRQAITGEANEPERSMASTVVALRVDLAQARAAWVHVGDSRLYLQRAGNLELLTADHTIVGSRYSDEDKVPTDLPHSNRLLLALGTGAVDEVAARHRPIQAGDVLLLCSDGVSGLITPEVIAESLATSSELGNVGAQLLRLALEAGGKDNASVVLVRIVAD